MSVAYQQRPPSIVQIGCRNGVRSAVSSVAAGTSLPGRVQQLQSLLDLACGAVPTSVQCLLVPATVGLNIRNAHKYNSFGAYITVATGVSLVPREYSKLIAH